MGSAAREVTKRTRRALLSILYLAAAGVGLVCVYFACLYFVRIRRPALALTLEGDGAEVRITWNRDSAAVRDAQGGDIQVQEGGATTPIALDRELLRTGTIVYLRKSKEIVVRMRVGKAEETAAFVSSSAPEAGGDLKSREQAGQINELEEIDANAALNAEERTGTQQANSRVRRRHAARSY